MQEFISNQLDWLNENGQLINSCEFDYNGVIISFYKHTSGWWRHQLADPLG